MKFLTALGLLFLFFSCSGGGGKSIKLSELDQSLAVYENKEGLDGIKKSVTYSVTGKKNYDEIFKESAKTAAILKQLNFALEKANKNPEETFDKLNQVLLKLNINPKKIKSLDDLIKEIDKKATPKDKEDLFLIYNLNFGIKKVPEIIKTSKKMKDDVTKLNPKNDFKGTDAMKIPSAISGVASTLKNIETSVKDLPKILENSKNLTGNLFTYLQSGTFDKNAVVQKNTVIETTEMKSVKTETENITETKSVKTETENNGINQIQNTNSDKKEVKVIISVIPNNDVSQNTVNIFKSGMENSLALKNYVIIPSELETNQCSSNDINCFIKIAKFSKADEIILIETQKIKNKYMFKLKIINVEKNGISKSTSKFYDGDISNFDYLLTFAESLTNKMLGNVSVVSENNKTEKLEKETNNYKLYIMSDIDSKIFINTIHKGNQQLSTTLKPGTYKIKVTKDGYEDYEEELILDKDTNKTITLNKNSFNFKISSNVEADVYINDELKGKTPFEATLKKEIYKLTLKKEDFEKYEEELILDKDTNKTITLNKNIYKLYIMSDIDSKIFVNTIHKGNQQLSTTLKPGTYKIKVTKDGYEDYEEELILDKDTKKTVTLNKNSFNFKISSNVEADVYINDELKGKTPFEATLKKEIYKLTLKKEDFEKYEEELILDKDTNKTITLNKNSFNFKISSNVEADVYINDELKGKTPFEATLKKGIYKLTLKKEGYEAFEFEGKVEKDIDKEFNLIQNLFNIELNSNVEADIYINDELKGKTPLHLTLKKGDYKILFQKDGYENHTEKLIINENTNKTITMVTNIQDYDNYNETLTQKIIILKNYNFGIKAGFGTSSYNWFNGMSYNYNVGGLFKYNLGIVKVQTELLFVSKNKNYKDINLSQLSIDLPLIFGVNIGNKSLYTGLYVSETFFVKMDKGTELKNDGLVANLGWLVGFDVKISNFLIDLRFSKDYSSIIDIDGKKLFNELFSLNFGYLF